MNNKILFAAIICISALAITSCKKESSANSNSVNGMQADGLQLSTCDQFSYPDSVFYPVETSGGMHFLVNTVTPITGIFGSYPDGLKLNTTTGQIDITSSETGLRYMVWFKVTGSADTCKKYITISGINFMDSVYFLKNNPGLAVPIYNATPNETISSISSGDEFDDGNDDDDGDGFDDEPPVGQEVIPQGIALDKTTGNIDLKQSIANGALGVNPLPGTFKDFILNYRVGDASTKALNTISFRLFYYHKTSEIPASLKRQYIAKRKLILFNQPQGSGLPGGTFSSYSNFTGTQRGIEVKCRPAYIIVVQ